LCFSQKSQRAQKGFRLTAKNSLHRKHGKHRNGGLRPWAASQRWVTQMAQITRIMLALRQETPAVCPGKFKKIEIHKKLLLYI